MSRWQLAAALSVAVAGCATDVDDVAADQNELDIPICFPQDDPRCPPTDPTDPTDPDPEPVPPRPAPVPRAPTVCRTAPLRTPPVSRKRADLANVFSDQGSTSIQAYPSTGSSFLSQQWTLRDGGFSSATRWASGDFDGDGDQDLVGIWNDGNDNTLTVRRSTGSSFTHEHWLIRAGGFMDTTQWLPGDFDGDGRTDLAAVWNDGGQVTVSVYRSTGSSFEWHRHWQIREGGWADNVQWNVGNVDGDRFDDLIAVWNDGGANTLTVRRSNGSSFTHEHWAIRQGGYSDETRWLAGDFDGNGLSDLAAVWNEGGRVSLAVYPSTGTAFGFEAWATREGGFSTATRWTAADFDADGRTDLAAIWKNQNRNTLTVRRSTGAGFSHEHWLQRTSPWSDTAAWCAGAFDAQ